MYTGIFALGGVAVSVFRHYIHIDLMHFIMGDILGVADIDLWVSAFVAAPVLTILILFSRHFQLATFGPIMAASIGLPVVFLDYLLTTCVSLVVVSAVSMVGVILVVLTVAPKYGLLLRWIRMHNLSHPEHLHGKDTIDYLDKKLGSPKQDSHGKMIPE